MKKSKIKLYVYIAVGMVAVASMVLTIVLKPWKTLATPRTNSAEDKDLHR